MQPVVIEWVPNGIRKAFMSEDMGDALYKAGSEIANEAQAVSVFMLKGRAPTKPDGGRMYGCKTKRLKNTCIAVVYPLNRAAFAVEAKHRILKRIATK